MFTQQTLCSSYRVSSRRWGQSENGVLSLAPLRGTIGGGRRTSLCINGFMRGSTKEEVCRGTQALRRAGVKLPKA